MTSKELREKRKAVATEMRSILDKGTLTAEDTTRFDTLDAEQTALDTEIKRFEKVEGVETELTSVRSIGIGREDRGVVTIEVKPEQKQLEAYRSYLLNGPTEMPSHLIDELRSLTLSGTSGYTAPAIATTDYYDKLRDFSDIRKAPITVINTATGNDIPYPIFDDTGNSASNPTTEASDVGTAGDPTLSQIIFKSYMTTSGVLKVSRQFLRDSVQPIEQYLNTKIVERIAVIQNTRFTTGTGSSQPQGIVTGSATGLTLSAGHTAALGVGGSDAAAAKDLLANLWSLVASVHNRYQSPGKTGFMCNYNTFVHLQKYVDGNGRPLLQAAGIAGLATGAVATLLGYPIWINSAMADIGVSTKPLLFGNFSYFQVRDVGTIAVDRLEERYAEYLMVGFNGYHAVDSHVMDSGAIKALVTSAT
jgi:HK97 family phage major capsid protein